LTKPIALLLFFLGALPLVAGPTEHPAHLPANSQWQLTGVRQVGAEQLQKLGGDPAIEREYGVSSVMERTYEKNGKSVDVFLERAADPSSAYGLFTLYQKSNMQTVKGVQLAMADGDSALMARGRYFIRIIEPADAHLSPSALTPLLITVGGAHLTVDDAERLPQRLPKQGLIPGTERYLLGVQAAKRVLGSFPVKAIGFQDSAEALVGEYISSGEKLTLLAISYPTPQLAQLHYQDVHQQLHSGGQQALGPVYGQLKGPYVLLVLHANSTAAATHLLRQFSLSEFVTLTPGVKRRDSFAYQLVNLVLANFELIGIILVCGVVAGILAAIVKYVIIRRFPQSTLSRNQDNTLTKLKL
jgi:hypothetical protein